MSPGLRTAFLAGYVPPSSGPYFNGLELLAQAERGATVELARQIGAERDQVVARRDAALAGLDRSEALLGELGIEPPARPEEAAGFEAWAEAVFAVVADALAARHGAGSPQAVAHLLGYVMGEAVAILEASALLERVRDLAPDHLLMRFQADSLERERQTATRRLGRLASHDGLPEAVRTATALAAHAAAEAAPTGDHLHRAARAASGAAEVAAQAAAVEGVLPE